MTKGSMFFTLFYLWGEKKKAIFCHKIKVRGKKKPFQCLCFPSVRNLHPHPGAAHCTRRWMPAWPNSMALWKAKTLPTPGPKIPHRVPDEANFQWQAMRTEATKALAGLGTSRSLQLFQGCSVCQRGASRGN